MFRFQLRNEEATRQMVHTTTERKKTWCGVSAMSVFAFNAAHRIFSVQSLSVVLVNE